MLIWSMEVEGVGERDRERQGDRERHRESVRVCKRDRETGERRECKHVASDGL